MKRLLVILLLILAACSESGVRTVPTSNYTPTVFDEADRPVDPCAAVLCAPDQHCVNGACVCESGKPCGNKCIASTSCCTNADCSTQNCVSNKCMPAKECNLGQELVDGACECASDKVFCREQNKCIKKGDCCYFGNCPQFHRCQPTTYRSSICIQLGEKKLCKTLGEVRHSEFFEIGNSTFNTDALAWLSDKSLKVSINGLNHTLAPNSTQTIGDARVHQEGIDILGGKCEPDEDDED